MVGGGGDVAGGGSESGAVVDTSLDMLTLLRETRSGGWCRWWR